MRLVLFTDDAVDGPRASESLKDRPRASVDRSTSRASVDATFPSISRFLDGSYERDEKRDRREWTRDPDHHRFAS